MEDGPFESLADETLGTKDKFWVEDDEGVQWLFKYARDKDGVHSGRRLGRVVCLRHCKTPGYSRGPNIAGSCRGRRGSLSRKILANDAKLVHGNELLQRPDPGYDGNEARRNSRYSVESIQSALAVVDSTCHSPLTMGTHSGLRRETNPCRR